jgi:hypothetical protein
MTPPDWEGDRELAKQPFLKSVALALEVLPARDLNFFAWRILFQMDSKGRDGLAGGAEGVAQGGASEEAAEGSA